MTYAQLYTYLCCTNYGSSAANASFVSITINLHSVVSSNLFNQIIDFDIIVFDINFEETYLLVLDLTE